MKNLVFQDFNYLGDNCLDIVIAADFNEEIKRDYDCPLIYVSCQNGEMKSFLLCNEGIETKHSYSDEEVNLIKSYVQCNDLLNRADWGKVKTGVR